MEYEVTWSVHVHFGLTFLLLSPVDSSENRPMAHVILEDAKDLIDALRAADVVSRLGSETECIAIAEGTEMVCFHH